MTRALLLSVLFALSACGGGDAPATTPATTEDPGASTAEEPAAGGEEPAAAEEPAPAVGCDKEVALTCESGFTDGCLSKLTLVHVCVADSEKKAGPPPCKMEIARQCPDGQVDACLVKPRQAKNHICVVAPK
jgi:hypothetical protein